MNGVHVIPLYHIADHVGNIIAHFGDAGIEIFFIPVGEEPLGFGAGDMIGRNAAGAGIGHGAVGIEPGVEFHAAFMRFRDHEFQGIVIRNGRLPLPAGKVFAPGS